jgi:hypothetical protein
MPFVLGVRIAASPKGVFVVGNPDDGHLDVYNARGALTRTIEYAWEPIRILNEEKQAWMDRMRSYPQVDQAYLNRVELPDHRQAFFTLVLDDEDRIWLERTRSKPRETPPVYDVITREGEWLGSQSLQERPTRIANGFLYQTIISEDHGPRLIRYRLEPRFRE